MTPNLGRTVEQVSHESMIEDEHQSHELVRRETPKNESVRRVPETANIRTSFDTAQDRGVQVVSH